MGLPVIVKKSQRECPSYPKSFDPSPSSKKPPSRHRLARPSAAAAPNLNLIHRLPFVPRACARKHWWHQGWGGKQGQWSPQRRNARPQRKRRLRWWPRGSRRPWPRPRSKHWYPQSCCRRKTPQGGVLRCKIKSPGGSCFGNGNVRPFRWEGVGLASF